MRVIIESDYQALSEWAANYVAQRINQFQPSSERPFVLGLPTGSSPLGMYKALIELNREGKVSFRNVVTLIWMNTWAFPNRIRKATIRLCSTTFSTILTFRRKTSIS